MPPHHCNSYVLYLPKLHPYLLKSEKSLQSKKSTLAILKCIFVNFGWIHSVKLWRRRRRGCILPESNFCSTFSTIPHLSSPYFAFLDFTILYFPLSYFVNYSSSVLPSPATSLYMNSSLTVKGRRGTKVWRSENLPGKKPSNIFSIFSD